MPFQEALTATEKRKLTALAAKKKKLERERVALLQRVAELDRDVILAQTQFGALHNSRLPQILRIPNELIACIFRLSILGIDWDENFSLTDEEEVSRQPCMEVYLSHVCSHWRSIALGLPDLWTTFRYQGRQSYNPRLPRSRLEAYLARSGHQLLNLWFDFRRWGTYGEESAYDITEFLGLILPHAGRWHRLRVISDENHPVDSDFQEELQNIHPPHLTHFTFCPDLPYEPSDPRSEMPEDVQDLDSLIFETGRGPLSLSYLCLDMTSFWLYLPPLHTVTILRIIAGNVSNEFTFSVSAFFDLLKLPSLAELFIEGEIFALPEQDDPIWGYRNVQWRTLEQLHISNCTALLDALPRISAPELWSLVLENIDVRRFDTPTSNYHFPKLRSLRIVKCNFDSVPLKSWLSSATRLITSVDLTEIHLDDSMLEFVTDADELPTFPWPHLEVAWLNHDDLDDTDLPQDFSKRFNEAQLSISSTSGGKASKASKKSKLPQLKVNVNSERTC